jgi:hypothetical protein
MSNFFIITTDYSLFFFSLLLLLEKMFIVTNNVLTQTFLKITEIYTKKVAGCFWCQAEAAETAVGAVSGVCINDTGADADAAPTTAIIKRGGS